MTHEVSARLELAHVDLKGKTVLWKNKCGCTALESAIA